jgi:hypothetical protein
MPITIEDSPGVLWSVTSTNGSLTFTKGAVGSAAAVYLNDQLNQTSWLVTLVIVGGNPDLDTTGVPLNVSYPAFVSLSTSYNLGVSKLGQLQVQQIRPITTTQLQLTKTPGATSSGQILPLTSSPNQSFSSTLQVDGAPLTLNFTVKWNTMAGYWVMSISNSQGTLLLDSIPLITGWYPGANLLGQFAYLQIGSLYILNEGTTDLDYPDQNTLGTGFAVLWSDTVQVLGAAA